MEREIKGLRGLKNREKKEKGGGGCPHKKGASCVAGEGTTGKKTKSGGGEDSC